MSKHDPSTRLRPAHEAPLSPAQVRVQIRVEIPIDIDIFAPEEQFAAILDGVKSLETRLALASRKKAAARPAAQADPPAAASPIQDAPAAAAPPPTKKRPSRAGVRLKPITHAELNAMHERVDDWLTERQRVIVRLVADGLSDAEIATKLGINQPTVGVHLSTARKILAGTEKPLLPGRPRKRRTTPPTVTEGSVWCPLCQMNRTQLHVDQHRVENEREATRQAAGRAAIAGIAPVPSVGPGALR